MEKKQYDPASISDATLQQVRSLEKTLSEENGEEIILVAYGDDSKIKDESMYKG